MTEEEYWEAQRESEAYYEQQAIQDAYYEWLSAFEFLQRTLARMENDRVSVSCGAHEMFRSFLQKEWEQAHHFVRCN